VLDRSGIPVPWTDRLRPAADTAFQTVRTRRQAHSDVLAMVAHAVPLSARSPRSQERTLRDNP
jgi:hypothetical protein